MCIYIYIYIYISAGPPLRGPPGCEGFALSCILYPVSYASCILHPLHPLHPCILQACILHFAACSLYPASYWLLLGGLEPPNLPRPGHVIRMLWSPRPTPKIHLKIDSKSILPQAPQMEPHDPQELPKWSPEIPKLTILLETVDIDFGCYLQYFSHIWESTAGSKYLQKGFS